MDKDKKFNNGSSPAANTDNNSKNDIENLTPQSDEIMDVAVGDEENQVPQLEQEILNLNESLQEEKKKYMFLYADFDNYRKRTIKEKSELIKNGGEQAFKGLLPIMDDFERGLEACKSTEGSEKVCEGMELIYNKLKKYLEQNGVKEFGVGDTDFDADRHEAISAVPVADEAQKGKIIDTVQKGYTINDKVLRHAKVVVGQ